MQNNIKTFRNIVFSHMKAIRNITNAVCFTRDEVVEEAFDLLANGKIPYLLGVKNTNQIDRKMVDYLKNKGFLFHTIDSMSYLGRAIDTNQTNPITTSTMTGSTSGGCINVLYNINDVCLGTDGGGSIISPALSTSLYSISLKGFGVRTKSEKISTDGIKFYSSIGSISSSYSICKQISENILGYFNINFSTKNNICTAKILVLNNLTEEKRYLKKYYTKLFNLLNSRIYESEFELEYEEDNLISDDRNDLIFQYESKIEKYDVLIFIEGPIDVDGIGDSIIGSIGEKGREIQKKSNKTFTKIANMVDSTFIGIPIDELSTGIVIMAKKGVSNGIVAMRIGEILSKEFKRNKVFENYFINSKNKYTNGFI